LNSIFHLRPVISMRAGQERCSRRSGVGWGNAWGAAHEPKRENQPKYLRELWLHKIYSLKVRDHFRSVVAEERSS
jgi:hypothetical protein